MKKSFISALTTALVVGAASTTFAAANPFSDVPAEWGDAFRKAGEYLGLSGKKIAVEPPNPRALPAPELANTLTLLGAEAQSAGSVEAGVLAALEQAKPGDCVLAFGSLYMLGQVRSCIFDRCKRENVHIRQD